jgi:hypothetical protein
VPLAEKFKIGLFSILRSNLAAHRAIKLKGPLDGRAQLQRSLLAIGVEYAGNRIFDLIALAWPPFSSSTPAASFIAC